LRLNTKKTFEIIKNFNWFTWLFFIFK